MTENEVKAYLEFVSNPCNIRNCKECPDNRNFDDYQGRFPCGQWHCHIYLCCKHIGKVE